MNFKNITFIISIAAIAFVTLNSCSKPENNEPQPVDELEGLTRVSTLSDGNHLIELYTANGHLQTGYNQIYFQIKNEDGSVINNANPSWTPVMKMTGMSHSCPASPISKDQNATATYKGYIVFQMAGNTEEFWELTIDYTVNGTAYSITGKIDVSEAPRRVSESFVGSDESRYIVALVEPQAPKVAVNDMIAVVYQMKNMMEFAPVENFKLKIDPRMPGMGNHSSPNNQDLTQGEDEKFYGKLSLTMTGYWKINLQLENELGTVVKGEEVTDANESSSIYFELEF